MTRHLPPIQGVPTERPVCAYCGNPLPVVTKDEYGGSREIVARTFWRWGGYNGLFDKLKCARFFAVAAHRAGYRIK